MQSTNEELHSVNEELFTVNTDHQRKIAELVEVTEDLNNLLTSTEIGVIFLDRDLRIRKYTDSVKQIFDLVDSDIGRKITSFSDRFGSDSFPEMLSQVRSNGEAVEREVSTESGESYLLRILPYATIAEQPSDELQVVVTIVDITTIKSAEQNQSRLARLIDESDDFIVSTDGNGKVETWNRGAERMIRNKQGRGNRSTALPATLRAHHRKTLREFLRITPGGPIPRHCSLDRQD